MNNLNKILKLSNKKSELLHNEEFFFVDLKSKARLRGKKDGKESGIFLSKFKENSCLWESEFDGLDRFSEVMVCPVSTLKNMVNFCSKDETRWVLGGILIQDEKMCATDGSRILVSKEGPDKRESILFPSVIMKEILSLIDKKIEVINILYHRGERKTKFYIKLGNIEIIGECISGEYPNYRLLFDSKIDRKVDLKITGKLLEKYKEINKIYGKKFKKYFHINENIQEIKVDDNEGKLVFSEKFSDLIEVEEGCSVNTKLDLELLKDFLTIDFYRSSYEKEYPSIRFESENYKAILMGMRG